MEQWSDTILRIGYTWTKNPEDAQDICQTVLLKLLTRPSPCRTEQEQRAWVIRITVNACKDYRRSAWFRHRAPLEAAEEPAVQIPEPEDGSVLQAVQSLPEKYRQVIYLHYYEEYTVAEIAELLHCPAARVSTWMYRAKAKLRTMLGGTYGQQCILQ